MNACQLCSRRLAVPWRAKTRRKVVTVARANPRSLPVPGHQAYAHKSELHPSPVIQLSITLPPPHTHLIPKKKAATFAVPSFRDYSPHHSVPFPATRLPFSPLLLRHCVDSLDEYRNSDERLLLCLCPNQASHTSGKWSVLRHCNSQLPYQVR